MNKYWAGTPNYNVGNYGRMYLFPHWTAGGFAGSVATLQNPARQSSAHYVIEGETVAQLVNEGDTAWHCGNSYYNWRSISYELVGWPGNPPSRTTLDTCAALMAQASRDYFGGAQLVLGDNVLLHKMVSATDCPGETDIGYLIGKANEILTYGNRRDINGAWVTIANQAYTGSPVAPQIETDATYDASFSDNVEVGWGQAHMTGTGSWQGTRTVPFKILPASLVGYEDVDPSAWYVQSVRKAVESGVMKGYSSRVWGCNDYLTRASAVSAIANAEGFVGIDYPFSDVEAPYYYETARYAVEQGWLKGVEGKLLPDSTVLRQDLCVMLWRQAGEPEASSVPDGFDDWTDVSDYAKPAVAWAFQHKVIGGADALRPLEPCMRTEGAAMVVAAFAE